MQGWFNFEVMAAPTKLKMESEPQFPLLCKVLNGGIAGIVGVSIVYPIDLVKTRLQNQNSTVGEKLYKNMLDCFKKSYKAEGYFGMYRGSAVNILLVTPEKAIKLTANDGFRHMLLDRNGKLTLVKEMTAGGLAGFCQTVVTTPMELLKIQLQIGAKKVVGHRASAFIIASHLVSSQGVRGLYRGGFSTILRDVSFSILYFPLFAHLKSLGSHNQGNDDVTCHAPFYWSFISGCAAGGFAAAAVNPFDVVKTRLQARGRPDQGPITKPSGPTTVLMNNGKTSLAFLNPNGDMKGGSRNIHQPNVSSDLAYKGVGDAFTRIYKEEGWRAFYKGASCRVLVIAPLFGIAQTVYYLGVGEYLLGTGSK